MLSEQKKGEETEDELLFSVGMIADIQYADSEDGFNYTKTVRRRFRPSLQILKKAIKCWNDKSNENAPSLIISLGDIIDILNSQKQPKESISAMKTVLTVFNEFKPTETNQHRLLQNINDGSKVYTDSIISNEQNGKNDDDAKQSNNCDWIPKYPFFHNLVGNHELYNFDRQQLLKYQHGKQEANSNDVRFYYSFTPFPGFLFIMLDAYSVAMYGYEYCNNKHANYMEAEKLLNKYNPNDDKACPVPNTNGFDQRFRSFNGGFGSAQLLWLESQLKIAQQRKDNVLLFSHVPVYTNYNKDYDILAFDFKECLDIIGKYSCVKMYFAGHDHKGDLFEDKNGVHHVTFAGAIEAPENTMCFATASFHQNKLDLNGEGTIASKVFEFRKF